MMKIRQFLGLQTKKQQKSDFSAFFRDASSEEKKKFLSGVVRQANKDQRDLVSQYNITRKSYR